MRSGESTDLSFAPVFRLTFCQIPQVFVPALGGKLFVAKFQGDH